MNLDKIHIVLASKSPRRKELLSRLVKNFEIITADIDESLSDISPKEGVELLAIKKGDAVTALESPDCLVISSDTLVEQNNIALGKPKDFEDAKNMLTQLSGKAHNVHTGVAVHYKNRVFSGVDSTEVHFREISEKEIEDYIKTGEPMDKAGAYGIQGEGGKFVKEYIGEFDTVMGLSMRLTEKLIEEALAFGD